MHTIIKASDIKCELERMEIKEHNSIIPKLNIVIMKKPVKNKQLKND